MSTPTYTVSQANIAIIYKYLNRAFFRTLIENTALNELTSIFKQNIQEDQQCVVTDNQVNNLIIFFNRATYEGLTEIQELENVLTIFSKPLAPISSSIPIILEDGTQAPPFPTE